MIVMTREEDGGRWIPCDPEIRTYVRGGGPFTYIGLDGSFRRGQQTFSGDPNGEIGYRKHRADCAMIRRNAV